MFLCLCCDLPLQMSFSLLGWYIELFPKVLVLSSEISPDKVGSMGFLLLLQETSAFAFIA